MKILAFSTTYYPQMGGAERAIHELYTRLPEHGIEVDLVTPNLGGEEEEEPVEGFRVYRVGEEKRNIVSKFFSYQFHQYRKALELIKEEDYNLVHCQFVLPNGLIAHRISKKIEVPLVTNVHHFGTGMDITSPEENPFFVNPLMKFILKNSNLIVTTGLTQNNFLKWLFGNYPENATAIRLGSPPITKVTEKNRKDIKEKNGLKGKKVVFSIGRLARRKRFDEIIKAAEIVCEENDDVLFLIAGKGPEQEKLEAMVRGEGLGDNVKILGFVSDEEREDFFRVADVFAYASEFEGSGIVYTEAMSFSTPVVAYENEAIRDIIRDDRYGRVTKRNPEELARMIMELLDDKKLRKDIVKNCFELIQDIYNWDRHAEEYAKEFKKVIR